MFFISQHSGSPNVWKLSKRRGPKHDEESFNKILKILDMRSVFARTHEWDFANMVSMSTTKRKMTVGSLIILVIWDP